MRAPLHFSLSSKAVGLVSPLQPLASGYCLEYNLLGSSAWRNVHICIQEMRVGYHIYIFFMFQVYSGAGRGAEFNWKMMLRAGSPCVHGAGRLARLCKEATGLAQSGNSGAAKMGSLATAVGELYVKVGNRTACAGSPSFPRCPRESCHSPASVSPWSGRFVKSSC